MTTQPMFDVELRINGSSLRCSVEPRRLLANFLRDDLGLTGTKVSCDAQVCGACTVIMDGALISACTTLVVDTDGKDVLTVEGLAADGELLPIQRAFIEFVAYQCGFCTAGQLITAQWIIENMPGATHDELREILRGNVCRCGAYPAILGALESVLQDRDRSS